MSCTNHDYESQIAELQSKLETYKKAVKTYCLTNNDTPLIELFAGQNPANQPREAYLARNLAAHLISKAREQGKGSLSEEDILRLTTEFLGSNS